MQYQKPLEEAISQSQTQILHENESIKKKNDMVLENKPKKMSYT